MQLVPDTQIGQYVIEELLGEGGMASVYRVRHTVLGGLYALKVLKSPVGLERLLREGRAQSRLIHPNVTRVTDVVDSDGTFGLIMEYIAGPDLSQVLHAGLLRSRIDQADDLMRQVLAGVAAAHAEGLTHRDLKPSNVLVSVAADHPVAKVSDFGLVRWVDASAIATQTGDIFGTPAYMAPEQIADANGRGRSRVSAASARHHRRATAWTATPRSEPVAELGARNGLCSSRVGWRLAKEDRLACTIARTIQLGDDTDAGVAHRARQRV